MPKGQTFTEEEKRNIVREAYSKKDNVRATAEKHGIHPITISKWNRGLKSKKKVGKKATRVNPDTKRPVFLEEDMLYWSGAVYKRVAKL